ncbi:MAG: hypothetical protein PUB52_02980 [Lachnospiraceae bacterium]|nr:hypothetical protein [Lachnospiraceae bacterium]
MDYEVRVPFPQADDFEKVVKIINIEEEQKIKDTKYMSVYLEGVSERQVGYYVNAAIYLGLLTKNKDFSDLGKGIREKNSFLQTASLIQVLLSDRIIGTAFVLRRLMNKSIDRNDVAEMIQKEYPDYCEDIYIRRAQTVLSWTSWIDNQVKEE